MQHDASAVSAGRPTAPVYSNILEMIGNTPMIELTRFDTGQIGRASCRERVSFTV